MTGFFDFESLQDAWGKVLRDHARLRKDVNTDTIVNFFVTAYHIMDRVRALRSVPEAAVAEMYRDRDFDLCRFICNKGKHVELRQEPGYVAHSDISVPQRRYAVIVGNERIDVLELADAVVSRWTRFFRENGIQVESQGE